MSNPQKPVNRGGRPPGPKYPFAKHLKMTYDLRDDFMDFCTSRTFSAKIREAMRMWIREQRRLRATLNRVEL